MDPVKSSLRYPVVTLVLASVAVAGGMYALVNMPRMEDPTITIRQGMVLALYPGATSDQVEQQVTRKLEEHLFKFEEVRREKTYSTSRPGIAVLVVELEERVKDSAAFWTKLRHEMNETGAMDLPKGVLGPLVNSDFGDTVAMLVAIHGKRYGYRELHNYTDRIKDELRNVRDIGKLATYGEQNEEIRVTSSLERMSQYLADPQRVIQALQQRNVITSSGALDAEAAKVPLRTTGLFTTEEQIGNVLVDLSRTGQPVYIRDFANVERVYQDPAFVVRYDGEPGILLSIEMQKDRNVVQLGAQIGEVFERLRTILPPDIQLDIVANQPAVVQERMERLGEEFLLAIGAVILVTLVLLPFRVAVISAVAIPVTILTTVGVLDAIGVELHQVSIAALIVVLGIVVDDAIVIADNYVECLDRGLSRPEAAWRSVEEVLVPVLAATLTIIASFLPLLILKGSVGEFIRALPITVAVALSVSFVVAILLTPLLCRFFIRAGLHRTADQKAPKKAGLLDRLQTMYNATIVFFMRRKILAVMLGMGAVAAGVGLFLSTPQQFFPSAERNQFVIDLWMPQGTRIAATDRVMGRIEQELRRRAEIYHFAAFVGQSAPRFYYNVNPQLPDQAYGQFIVNTREERATPRLVAELRTALAAVAPEGLVIVKELQQGMVMEAPLEVRISGYDLTTLKEIGRKVEAIFRDTSHLQMVYHDYFNDSYFVDVDVDPEVSNRLGLSNAIISQTLAGAFSGAPVSTFWEGNRAVNIVLRLDPAYRDTFEHVRNAYMVSPVTQARVPLRSVADLHPQWQTSRIVRRNGVRTLSVRGFPERGYFASDIRRELAPKIDALPLPEGFKVVYAGEYMNTQETMPQMITALVVSVGAIFLVLLLQFRTLSDPLVVMASIPITLFGAVMGLVLTGYPFGFTAFTGLISLCGIVVRNSIILVDYIREKLHQGHSLEEAATEAGERRLRPIFLTTMAAAVGVTPMILSRSTMWGPLASVIAVGLVSSMFFTLIVVPVLYVIVKSRTAGRGGALAVASLPALLGGLLVLVSGPVTAAERQITLDEAVKTALRQNTALKIARAKVQEKHHRVTIARADYFPHITNETGTSALSSRQLLTVPAGSLGVIPQLGPFPTQTVNFDQGSRFLLLGSTMAGQPLTQLLKVRQGVRAAGADERVSEADLRKVEETVILGVHRLYFGLLAARRQIAALEAQVAASREALREAEESVRAGNALEVVTLGARASLLKNRQGLLAAQNQVADLSADLANVLGMALDTEFAPADLPDEGDTPLGREVYLKAALERSPELQSARQTETRAEAGVSAARLEYVPNVAAYARHTYQSGVPFLRSNFGTFGVQLSWSLFDWGKRKGVVEERQAQLTQAREYVQRIKDQLNVDIDKAWRKLERTRMMVEVAQEALALRRETERISGNQVKAGVTSAAKFAEAVAATRNAEADELQARLAYRLALAEIAEIAGLGVR